VQLTTQVNNTTESLKGREERVERLTQHLLESKGIMKSQFEELLKAQDDLRFLQDEVLKSKDSEIESLRAKVQELETKRGQQTEQMKAFQEKFANAREDLKVRIDQVRKQFESQKAVEDELRSIKERVVLLETLLETEKSHTRGFEQRIQAAHDGWNKVKAGLEQAEALNQELQTKLEACNDLLQSNHNDQKMSELQAENSAVLVKSRDQRLEVMQEKVRTMHTDIRTKQERIELLQSKTQRLTDEGYALKQKVCKPICFCCFCCFCCCCCCANLFEVHITGLKTDQGSGK
jgi:chromosome segregation ATPase